MLIDIMRAAEIPAQEARFSNPPDIHAVYFDSVDTDGPDGFNRIATHDCIVEIYAPTTDPSIKARLEAVLDAHGIHYTTQGWHWLDSLRRYQEIYEFTYIEKIGG